MIKAEAIKLTKEEKTLATSVFISWYLRSGVIF